MRRALGTQYLVITWAATCAIAVGCSGDEGANQRASEGVPSINLPDPGKADGLAAVTDPSDCPGGAPHLPNGHSATWTILHYAAADNNLEDVLLEDINEMEAGSRGTASVNILVQLDRRSEDGVWRYLVQPDSDREAIASKLVGYSEQEPDSGDWHTLASFGQWATTCYPADYYAVIIGGHGSGWSSSAEDDGRAGAILASAAANGMTAREIAPDDSHGSSMHIDELAKALTEIRRFTQREGDPDWMNRLALYGSDACLMATFEVTYDLRNTSTYLVGSEETEPGQGWPYSTIIRDLTERPSYYAQRPHELAKSIVHHYGDAYGPHGVATRPDQQITMSAVDASAAVRAKNAFEDATAALYGLAQDSEEVAQAVWDARGKSYEFSGFVDMAMYFATLRDVLLERALMPAVGQTWDGDPRARDFAHAVDALLTDVWPDLVLEVARGEQYPEAAGLSLYFPRDLCGWGGGPKIDTYGQAALGEDTMWDELVAQQVLTFGGGNPSYVGEGTATIATNGHGSVENLSVACRQKSGELTVRGAQDDTSFSVTLKIEGEALELTRVSWSLSTESGTQWFRLPWGADPIAVQNATFTPEQAFEAEGVEVALDTYDSHTGGNVAVPAVIGFSCPELTMKYCVD